MQCPYCASTEIHKNGKRRGKQNYKCVSCGRQFIDIYSPPKGYSDEVKKECLKLYVEGMGFRAIERSKGVHHTTIISWVKQLGEKLPDAPIVEEIPEVGELDELETFVGLKKQNLDLDSIKSFSSRNFGLDCWRSQFRNIQIFVEYCFLLEMLFLRNGWLDSLPLFY